MLGRILYALLFIVVLPVALVLWAHATTGVVPLPPVHSMPVGVGLAALGGVLMLAGMAALARHGGGLPMNAFPPPRYVDRGVYGLVANPIYVGFAFIVAGAALWTGSASGLWLVTPATVLAMTALVLGYERPDLRRRFGRALHRPRLALAAAEDRAPTPWERLGVYALVILPWCIGYEAVQRLGVPPDAIDTHLRFEASWPVLPWTEFVYGSAYVFVLLTPLVVRSARALRRLSIAVLTAMGVVFFLYLALPLVSAPRAFHATSLAGRLLGAEVAHDGPAAAFPSFHVIWVLLAAAAWPRRARPFAFAWAFVVTAACLTTGMHSLLDVLAAIALTPFFDRYDRVWAWLRDTTERVANGWAEWRIGPVRVLNRAFVIGLSGLVGASLVALALGPARLPALVVVSVTALFGAEAWAQWLEGSSMLLRPFGFYGGLIGGFVGVGIAWAMGYDPLVMLAGFSVGLPWAQGIGRFGCLINGCCHGGRAPAWAGIRYRHNRSRVTRIAGLTGVPLYPTQLYSILANFFLGGALIRLWTLGASPGLVAGLYLLVGGLSRFVEESYRDEPQTPTVLGLHVYHWLAIASIVGGPILTTLPAAAPMHVHALTAPLVWGVLGVSVFAALVMGVDFPTSNRRFSRLAPADGPPKLLPLDSRPDDSQADDSQADEAQASEDAA